MRRNYCLVCQSTELECILDLGAHAYADTFVPVDKKCDPLVTYNLSCVLCKSCGNVQTLSKTEPVDRYASLYEYSYTSSNSNTSKKHWINFCLEVSDNISLPEDAFVIEVGSNDGFLLKQFRDDRNARTLGIDASPHVSQIARTVNGIETKVAVFDSQIAETVLEEYGHANLVAANNVFNHSEDPVDFAKAAATLLTDDGTFVFEAPYWKCSIESEKIDQVYHEHVTYLTVKAAREMLRRANMVIVDVQVVNYHGGSLRVYAQKTGAEESELVRTMIEEEENIGLYDLSTYENLSNRLQESKFNFLKRIYEIKAAGGSLVAVGAAAKGNTFLTLLNLDNSVIDYVTDASEYKQGKLTPLTSIPIRGDEIFADYGEVYAIILSWNISDKIKQKLNEINPEIKFLVFSDF